jgi:DNA repair protein RadC
MRIKDVHKEERPRERLINYGVNKLSNVELLEIILSSGNKEKSVIDLANEVIALLKNFSDIGGLTFRELTRIKGIKNAKASILLCAIEIGKRIIAGEITNKVIFKDFDALYNYYYPKIGSLNYEKMYILYLDVKGQLISEEELSSLNSGSIAVDTKIICIHALKLSCYGIIMIHNHPSGNPSASSEDISTTITLKNALNIINVKMLEHLIVGKNKYYLLNKNITIIK